MVRGHENRGPDVFVFLFFFVGKGSQGQQRVSRFGCGKRGGGSSYFPPVTLCSDLCTVLCRVPLVLLHSELCPSLYAGPAVNSVRQAPCREPNRCNHWPVWRVRSSVDEEPQLSGGFYCGDGRTICSHLSRPLLPVLGAGESHE